MGRLIMVTGGARSGKSTFAEEKAKGFGNRILYIATSTAFDDEMKERVRRHREQRPSDWKTAEAYRDLDQVIARGAPGCDAVLIDCITIMVSNIMLEKAMDWEGISVEEVNRVEEDVKLEIGKLISAALSLSLPVIVVTNELGLGVVPPSELGRAVRDIAGRANQMLAKAAEEVYMCISGIPLKIK